MSDEFEAFLAYHAGKERGLRDALEIVQGELHSSNKSKRADGAIASLNSARAIEKRISAMEKEKNQPLFEKTGVIKRKQ